MSRGRLEAFSDGVLAIVITIMVLELVPPHDATLDALVPLWPKFLSYVMIFAFIGIYWNNHHHLLHTTHAVTGRVMWANLHLLFWLSIVPFGTPGWARTTSRRSPLRLRRDADHACHRLLAPGRRILRVPGQPRQLADQIGSDIKGKASIVAYGLAIPIALYVPMASVGIYIAVAAIWIVPDPRFERVAAAETSPPRNEESRQ